ncbi:prepilin peptidase [Pandoraea anapnoica]|uniref:Prepilin leader peptidase/N-methyltransferase n=1 Tax=Pandoraea anapnoica TaxID=2508301 RepID=A0A5E5AN50_9BURK|nr:MULTISPECIES: A24 family peptidase [Pandoraea]VVE58412.1 prepilin peptidase [Pandoraea iniqua]VVE75201.1 prepilin peptidase [Pandoraea anapnoica]
MEELISLLASSKVLLGFVAGAIGLCVGSFVNVIVGRVPIMIGAVAGDESLGLCFPRSRCPACRHPLAPWDNIPVFSFLALRGKCRYCSVSISFQYPAIECVTAVAYVVIAAVAGWDPRLPGWCFLATVLIALSGIDLLHLLLPDRLTLPLLWAGLLANSVGIYVSPRDAIVGAVCGYLLFASVGIVSGKIAGREALGMGDAKLLAALGAWIGYRDIPMIVLLAAMATLVGMLVNKLRGGGTSQLPFGPGLAIAGMAVALIR